MEARTRATVNFMVGSIRQAEQSVENYSGTAQAVRSVHFPMQNRVACAAPLPATGFFNELRNEDLLTIGNRPDGEKQPRFLRWRPQDAFPQSASPQTGRADEKSRIVSAERRKPPGLRGKRRSDRTACAAPRRSPQALRRSFVPHESELYQSARSRLTRDT